MLRAAIAWGALAIGGPSVAAEVDASFFGPNATLQTFETAGGTGFYFGGPLELEGTTYAGAASTQAGQFGGCRTGRCVGNNLDGATFRITLNNPVTAAGAYVSGFSNAWQVQASFFGGGNELLGTLTRQGSGVTPLFVGFQSLAAPIARVEFADLTADLRIIVVDEFTTLTAVPEPSAWAMMVGGFGLLGAAARTRRRSALV